MEFSPVVLLYKFSPAGGPLAGGEGIRCRFSSILFL